MCIIPRILIQCHIKRKYNFSSHVIKSLEILISYLNSLLYRVIEYVYVMMHCTLQDYLTGLWKATFQKAETIWSCGQHTVTT